jgi:hypothetical protein
MAKAMIDAGHAVVAHENGRVKSIRLIPTAHLVRIGEPTTGWGCVRFVVREKLDGGGVVWKHHPRATY